MSKYGIQKKGTGKALKHITGQKPYLPNHPSQPSRPKFKEGGRTNTRRENRLEELGRVDAEEVMSKNWIQDVNKSIKRRGTKGKCTPITKPGCTGRAKALAKTFKKMAKKRKKT
jgi:hypothetical protein